MILLSTATDIIQAASGSVAAFFAFLVYRQQERFNKQEKKIKELADIAVRLHEQNEIILKEHELNQQLALRNVMPFFVKGSTIDDDRNDFVTIKPLNQGQDAIEIKVSGYSDNITDVILSPPEVQRGRYLTLTVKLKVDKDTRGKYVKDNYMFTINFKNHFQTEFYQTIRKEFGSPLIVDPPVSR